MFLQATYNFGKSEKNSDVSLNEKLKEKLNTLDEEIKRYRQENAAIEQIRREKEKVCVS